MATGEMIGAWLAWQGCGRLVVRLGTSCWRRGLKISEQNELHFKITNLKKARSVGAINRESLENQIKLKQSRFVASCYTISTARAWLMPEDMNEFNSNKIYQN